MPGLKLFTGNRMEMLIDRLAECLTRPLSHPLASEVILVQSKGMERWLSMELAKRHGVCVNCRFPYPIHFINTLFHETIEDIPETSPYEQGIMTWDIIRILPDLLDQPAFQNLRAYLGGGEKELKLFQLADKIAGLFDQYLLFRPDMMLNWEQGKDEQWQAVLWREIAGEKGPVHRAALFLRFLKRMQDEDSRPASIPERVSLFGLSALPPFHIRILAALSSRIDVNLFLMNPCREFWGDIVSDRRADRLMTVMSGPESFTEDDLHLEAGNSLLASMGNLGREFFKMIADLNAEEISDYEDPDEKTILGAVQSDILNLRERSPAAEHTLYEKDTSIRIHSCHSPLREIEVLQDYLLNVFEENPHLQADDILVMVPAIETYAPFIKAIFSIPRDDPRWMPFTIADRGLRQESDLIDTFLKILDLPDSRMAASRVYDILQSRAVQNRFLLSEDDLELLHHWIIETGIRWGIDGNHKRALNLPAIDLNTWRGGLDRLLLGYAMPVKSGEELFEGILPYGAIEGANAETLGHLLNFMETLFGFTARLENRQTLQEWSILLQEMMEVFFSKDEAQEREVYFVRNMLAELVKTGKAAKFGGEVSVNIIRAWLQKNFEEQGFDHGFLAGGVTFCTLLPMRSIPFKCVCLIGMDYEAYPRRSRTLGFDLMAKSPRIGDRSRRNDDRYLFLEALLSAQEKLYISYCGQSMEDNSLRPPSVLVSELLDTIESGFGRDVRKDLCVRHRLQAFNPEYFSGRSRLFSYSEENLRAARSALLARKMPTPFIVTGLSEPDENWKHIDLESLCRFFSNPARFLLSRRLGIFLDDDARRIDESEPFELNKLEEYFMKQDLAARTLQGRSLKGYQDIMEARGKLPHGVPGRYVFDAVSRETEKFMERIRPHLEGDQQTPIDAVIEIGDYRLTGRLAGIYREHLLQYRPAKMKADDRLRAWIMHLVLNHSRVDAPTNKTILCAEDVTYFYRPVDDAEDYLRVLISLYWEGLIKPLHFFSDSSMIYAERTAKGKDQSEALRAARTKWEDYRYPEKDDPYYQLCFPANDPLDGEFHDLAVAVCSPMLRYEQRVS